MRTSRPEALPDLLVIEPEVHADERGHFFEAFQEERYGEAGVDVPFVQDNVARSRRGVLRGLHYQHPHAQGKLIQVLRGAAHDVAVDLRPRSPTFGEWLAVRLTDRNRRQLWIPTGFAHGYLALDEPTEVHYKCTELYRPEAEHGLRWDDPALGIEWPLADAGVDEPILSGRDAGAPTLEELRARGHLPGDGGPGG